MTRTRPRRATAPLAALACAVSILVASGCGASGSNSSGTSDPVTLAAMHSTNVAGYRLTMNMRLTSPALSQALTTTGTGAFNVHDKSGSFSLAMDLGNNPRVTQMLGTSTLQMEEVLKWPAIYMKLPPIIASQIPGAGGKSWMKIDMSRAAAAAGSPGLSSLMNNPTSSDPSQMLQYLRAVSGNVSQIGKEQVGGFATTHYSATIDLAKVTNSLPESSRAAMQQSVNTLTKMLGRSTLPVEVWVDGQNLVRQMKMSYSVNTNGKPTTFDMTIDIPEYGPQPAPVLPPADQVTDLSSIVGGTP